MSLLDEVVRRRLAASRPEIARALRLAAHGNPYGAENARRLSDRVQAKVGLPPQAARAFVSSVVRAAEATEEEADAEEAPPRVRRSLDDAERIWGDTIDFVGIAFLERGARVARSVGRVVHATGRPRGSGVLVGGGMFLTNAHVIESAGQAPEFVLEMDYEQDIDGRDRAVTRFALEPQIFVSDPVEGLDFTLVGVGERLDGPHPIEEFGFSGLSDARDKHMIGEFANIVQHPDGRRKEVVLRENRLVNRFDDVLHYVADTEPGSSGAPVYNSEWQMIALHHWGGPWAVDPELVGDLEINEGIRASSIVRKLRARLPHLPIGTRQRVEIALSLGAHGPEAARRREDERARAADQGPRIDADGRVTWTVPVELSVRLPQGMAPAPEPAPPPAPAISRPAADESLDYDDRDGYDPGFLGSVTIPLPRLTDAIAPHAARLLDPKPGETPHELRYHHFSVVMNARRKLAFFTACNIDGRTAKSITRSTRAVSPLRPDDPGLRERLAGLEDAEADSWRHDPRIARADVAGAELYRSQIVPGFPDPRSRGRIARMFQKGHLVRRLDPAWGTEDQALAAEFDTFHWTNAAPQVGFFNMGAGDPDQPGTGGGALWRAAENIVLREAVAERERLNVFTGPVFDPDESRNRPFRSIRIPPAFFKIAVWSERGEARALAMLVDQSQVFDAWPERLDAPEALMEPVELEKVRDFLSTIEEIERLTGLDFGDAVRAGDLRAGGTRQEARARRDLPLTTEPAEGDPLERIDGLGETYAARLREMGIATFAQIAAWNEEELAEWDARIDARGRAVQRDWPAQARRLMEGRSD